MQVFGEWRYSFIVHVVMQMRSHLWHIGFSSNVILVAYGIVKSPQNELSSCCITFTYEYTVEPL